MYFPISHLPRAELRCKLQEKLHRVTGPLVYAYIRCVTVLPQCKDFFLGEDHTVGEGSISITYIMQCFHKLIVICLLSSPIPCEGSMNYLRIPAWRTARLVSYKRMLKTRLCMT